MCVCVCVKQINSIFDLSFYYQLVSYNTTGVLHSSDKMTECELTLAGRFEMRALPLPIKTPPFLKNEYVWRDKRRYLRCKIFKSEFACVST